MLKRFLWWLGRKFQEKPQSLSTRQPKLPEEYEEEYWMSLDMHYGDEPLYLLDPPEWPETAWGEGGEVNGDCLAEQSDW